MAKDISFRVQSELREYEYVAWVRCKTGRVVEITAGCRMWSSFKEARRHYRAEEGRWSPDWIRVQPDVRESYQRDALRTLKKLKKKVRRWRKREFN